MPRDSTTGDSVQYAPPSMTKSTSIATRRPVARHRRPVPRARRMPLGRRHHVLGAIVNELDRLAGLPRQQRRMTRDDRRVLFLAAKAAAGLHLHDAHLVGRQVEERPQRLVDVVRALHRAPDRDAVGGVRRRDHAVRFDVELFLRAGLVFALDDELGRRQRAIDVAARDEVVLEDVVACPRRSLGRRARRRS